MTYTYIVPPLVQLSIDAQRQRELGTFIQLHMHRRSQNSADMCIIDQTVLNAIIIISSVCESNIVFVFIMLIY